MQPENLNAWVSIFRDVAIVLVAAFLMIFAVLQVHEPTLLGLILGAGLTMLGVPPAIRVRAKAKEQEGEE